MTVTQRTMTKDEADQWIEKVRGELRLYHHVEIATGAVPDAFARPGALYASLTVRGDSVVAAFLPPLPGEDRLTVFLVEHFIASYESTASPAHQAGPGELPRAASS